MSLLRHFYGLNHLHYLTSSTYRRARIFDAERFKRDFLTSLADLRSEFGFRIVGYVLMPEHFHLFLGNPHTCTSCTGASEGVVSIS